MPPPQLPKRQWTRSHAAHLMCRAGFGGTPAQITALSALSPEDAVDSVLAYPPDAARAQVPAWFREEGADTRFPNGMDPAALKNLSEEERQKLRNEDNRLQRERLQEAQAWWLERMADSQHPLEEKLTLFWHGHFATSLEKVRGAYPLLTQNLTFREKGIGPFAELVEAVAKDPAMLVYLDNARSNARSPNENFARELMELFTLGEGHYSEDDIRNSARAFTGWSLDAATWNFRERPFMHDKGHKRFFGQNGRFDGRDIIQILLQKPRAADFLADKLWRFFASDPADEKAVASIASVLRETSFDIKSALRALFLHPEFYSPACVRTQIKGPVVFSIHLLRVLEGKRPPGERIARACRQLGQTLFAPPSVKGWDGGPAWITASTLALRYQFAEEHLKMRGSFDPKHILPDRSITRVQAREQLFDRFYNDPLRPAEQKSMDDILAAQAPPSDWSPDILRDILIRIVQQPQFQLI